KIFCARVHDQIDTEVRRSLVDRCGKGTVNKADELVLASQGGDLLQIDHAQRRIGGRLQVKQLRVWPDGARVLIVLDGIHKCGFDAEFWQPLTQEFCSPAVNVTLRNHVVAGLQESE